MNKEEQEIIESTKEFAKVHNIHYDQMTENMILNAMREQLLLHNVSQQRELLGCNHNQIRVDGKDVGTCVKCGVEMEKTWQPNCG